MPLCGLVEKNFETFATKLRPVLVSLEPTDEEIAQYCSTVIEWIEDKQQHLDWSTFPNILHQLAIHVPDALTNKMSLLQWSTSGFELGNKTTKKGVEHRSWKGLAARRMRDSLRHRYLESCWPFRTLVTMGRKGYKCSHCHQFFHNKRTCPALSSFSADTDESFQVVVDEETEADNAYQLELDPVCLYF